ncbi:MAG: 6-hydroxymethylpterin diphosphokinase MptE-like protein [Spirochaetota bacterium]
MNTGTVKYNIEASKDGMPTLSVINDSGKTVYFHSKYNPLKEAEILKSKFLPQKFDAIIILGAGLGYHLLALNSIKEKYNTIIIIDIIKDIEKEIAKNPETCFLTKSAEIKFITGMDYDSIEDALNTEIDFSEIKGLDIIDHPPSVSAFGEYYNEVKNIIRRLINIKAGNIATQKAFGWIYLKNIFKNFSALPEMHPVSALFNTMNKYAAIVVAAGPGIENNIREIKAAQNRFFIIAVDSAMKTLTHNGIIPDFFVSIDPQGFNLEHLTGLDTGRTVPLFSVSSSHLVVEKFKGQRALLSLNTHPVSQIIDDMFPEIIGHTDSKTGTVAGDAVMSAKEFGYNAIGLVGFDFSFTHFKIYPRGTAYQKRFANAGSRFNTVETINYNYIMKSSKGLKHGNKFTRRSFLRYKESMENFVKNSGIINMFNINTIGIPVQGIKNIDLQYFIDAYCGSEINKHEIIDSIFAEKIITGKSVSFSKIKAFILKNNIFSEIMRASLDAKTAEKKGIKLKTILKNTSSHLKL